MRHIPVSQYTAIATALARCASVAANGSSDWKGVPLQFRLKAMRLKFMKKNAPALAEAQSFLPEIVGKSDEYKVSTRFLEDYSATLAATTGTASVIRLPSSAGTWIAAFCNHRYTRRSCRYYNFKYDSDNSARSPPYGIPVRYRPCTVH
ncbi:hypothetical protein EWM63_11060 [Pseudoduganella lutea]|uniref:Uncharacterized protein n=1 Tax=Pseudoduganella lutea TaxID=321985 RepID=A0A4P6KYQ3_9BURK|nr:hypothetical protein EWM63_11060 [Pseudoduganella lutea]